MKQFKSLGIEHISESFIGDKIKIERVLNREITVFDFKVKDSKYEKGSGKCLHLQIAIADTKHLVFTGSNGLIDIIQKVAKEDFPFTTTIVKQVDKYVFT